MMVSIAGEILRLSRPDVNWSHGRGDDRAQQSGSTRLLVERTTERKGKRTGGFQLPTNSTGAPVGGSVSAVLVGVQCFLFVIVSGGPSWAAHGLPH